MSCKYREQGACKCEHDCDELDTQMLFAVVALILILIGFAVWSLI